MGKANNIKSPKKAAEIFERYMSQGLPVYDSKGNELILQDDEEFRQCYDENDPVRKVLPTSWFVSNLGNLISVYRRNKPEWLLRDTNDKNRDTYHFQVGGRIKIIASYALVGLVFGSEKFGTAEALLEEQNVHCFGNFKEDLNVQSHHIKNKKDFPELINDPENIEFMTVRAHRLCHQIPADDAPMQEKQKFMQKFTELCAQECPNGMVVAFRDKDGSCKLAQVSKLTFTEKGWKSLQTYISNIKKSLEYAKSLD